MPLRVTRGGMYEQTRSLLGRNTRRMAALQEQLATLKRINRPSDDPTGAKRALELRTDRASYTRYLDSIQQAQSRIDHSTSVLQSVSSYVARARNLVLQASNPETATGTRPAIADELNTIIAGLIDDANTSYEGQYVFSGTAGDTKPFVSDVGPGAEVSRVTYQGNTSSQWVTVGPDARTQVNESGQDVFMARGPGEDLFSVLTEARDIISNEQGLTDSEVTQKLSSKLAELDAVHSDVLESMGRLAGRAKSLELRRSLYEEGEIAATRSLSEEEDADVTEVVFNLQNERNQFQALLASSAALLKPTLMDFLT